MPDLAVIVPTRGRPTAAADLIRACDATCAADTVLVLCVDADDPRAWEYDRVVAATRRATMHIVREPAGHVGAINAGVHRALAWPEPPSTIAKLDDDHRPRTKGWDRMMLAALRELGTGIVYGDDLLQSERLPTAPAMTADIVQELGFMGPPTLHHLFVDNFWLELGRDAGCLRYVPDVVIEHMHPVAGKSEWTEGHLRVNGPGQYERDAAAYMAYRMGPFADDVAKVRALRRASEGVNGA